MIPLLFFNTFFLTIKTTVATTNTRAKAALVVAKVTTKWYPNKE
jgi:hypothetical protein